MLCIQAAGRCQGGTHGAIVPGRSHLLTGQGSKLIDLGVSESIRTKIDFVANLDLFEEWDVINSAPCAIPCLPTLAERTDGGVFGHCS